MSCRYTNTLKAEFGRKITAEEANQQFDAIETAMTCLEQLAESGSDTVIHNYGSVDGTVTLDPSLGNLQFITIEGDVSLGFSVPEENDPKVIYLLVEDGGDGRFIFPTGSAWASLSQGVAVTGKPWDSMGRAGDYGAVITCIYDNIGWLYLTHARKDIDTANASDLDDLYEWR